MGLIFGVARRESWEVSQQEVVTGKSLIIMQDRFRSQRHEGLALCPRTHKQGAHHFITGRLLNISLLISDITNQAPKRTYISAIHVL